MHENRAKLRLQEFTEAFNRLFGTQLTKFALVTRCTVWGISAGSDGHFAKGNRPHNKGIKGWTAQGTERTRFKKGHRPKSTVPVGTEIVNSYGYTKVKVSEPNVWKHKHVMAWEKRHGLPVPKNCVVLFMDGDKANMADDNLVLISRAELAVLNKRRFGKEPVELRPSLIHLAKLEVKANSLGKP